MLMIKYEGDNHTYLRKKKGRNYECSCQSIERREDGVYHCTFKKREDHLKKSIEEGKIHTCNFEKEEYNKVIEDFFNKTSNEKEDTEITYETILTKVSIFVGRKNLAIEAGACEELQDLIITAIKYGMQFPRAKIDDIYKKYSPDTVRKYVLSSAVEVNKLQFKKFGALNFVGVSIDEGSNHGIHNLEFVMENPLSNLIPYPCFTSVMKGGKANDYTEHIAKGVNFLKINKIPVASLTIDGNRAQLKALSFEWEDSLRNRFIDENEFIKKILINHCLCHRINNSYKAAYGNNIELKVVVDNLRDLCNKCRSNPEDVLSLCPSVQLTRWVIDYDICTFIINHHQRILKFEQFDIEEIRALHKVLSVLKSLTNIFESSKTPHFKAFRILENAFTALDELKEEIPYSEQIEEQLVRYTLKSKDAGLWMLSYILTPKGRADFSQRINKSTFPGNQNFQSLYSPGKIKEIDDIEAVITASIENIDLPPEEPDEERQDIEKILRPPVDVTPATNEEEEEIVEISSNHLSMGPAQEYLSSILDDWGIAPVSKARTLERFNSFVCNAEDIFSNQILENGDYFWANIQTIDPIWRVIGEIALRLHASPCSEASCERTLSTQRIVLTARRMSSKKQLLDARLILLRGLNQK